MRKIAQTAIADLEARRYANSANEGKSLWCDGSNLWSYGTCVLTFGAHMRPVINVTKYSRTTSDKQFALIGRYPDAVLVSGLPFGAGPDDLRAAAMEQSR